MARSDVGYSVRTAAVHVWKTVVSNTPRTTTEILPVLMSQLIQGLSCAGSPPQTHTPLRSLQLLGAKDAHTEVPGF